VLLVAVSKTVTVERIRAAVAAGVPALGENRVQEAREKIAAIGRPVPWHLIGSLQTNKVKDALACFDLIHSVDRLPLAEALSARAAREGRRGEGLGPPRAAGGGGGPGPRCRAARSGGSCPSRRSRAIPRSRGRTTARCGSFSTRRRAGARAPGSASCRWA